MFKSGSCPLSALAVKSNKHKNDSPKVTIVHVMFCRGVIPFQNYFGPL